MLAKAGENCFALAFRDFAFELRQREVNDVVVMDLLALQFFAQFKPNVVEKIDFLRRQMGECGPR